MNRVGVPCVLGDITDYEFTENPNGGEQKTSVSGYTSGKSSGIVQTGYVRDLNNDAIAHHMKGMAFSKQVDKIANEEK